MVESPTREQFEIFFLSYCESNAEDNWQHLLKKHPQAKRLHGVSGLKKAHQLLSIVSTTDFYFVIDGDNILNEDFAFEIDFEPQRDTLYVWRALNPVNQLVYGYGGVKLYNRFLFSQECNSGADLATTIATKYVPISTLASTTHFNNTPLESWRGAFRECAKLTQQLLKNPNDKPTESRLSTWLSTGEDKKNGRWCLLGAKLGRMHALECADDSSRFSRINDFQWLSEQFHALTETNNSLPAINV